MFEISTHRKVVVTFCLLPKGRRIVLEMLKPTVYSFSHLYADEQVCFRGQLGGFWLVSSADTQRWLINLPKWVVWNSQVAPSHVKTENNDFLKRKNQCRAICFTQNSKTQMQRAHNDTLYLHSIHSSQMFLICATHFIIRGWLFALTRLRWLRAKFASCLLHTIISW